MKRPRLRTFLAAPFVLFGVFYIVLALVVAFDDGVIDPLTEPAADLTTIAIFGASGTAGDGILKAALANPDVDTIHVITRRSTPRIAAGAESGKVIATQHLDYLDYEALREKIAGVDAVFWALGTSSIGVDEERYATIHVDFPVAFVQEWLDVSTKDAISFHYISSSDISAESRAMWARQKYRAEESLIGFAEDSKLRVLAYRPDYIGPTRAESHLGQELLYGFFAPVMAAVRAEAIGEAMLEAAMRGEELPNGERISTRRIRLLSEVYRRSLESRVEEKASGLGEP
jgi:hypothetical protein